MSSPSVGINGVTRAVKLRCRSGTHSVHVVAVSVVPGAGFAAQQPRPTIAAHRLRRSRCGNGSLVLHGWEVETLRIRVHRRGVAVDIHHETVEESVGILRSGVPRLQGIGALLQGEGETVLAELDQRHRRLPLGVREDDRRRGDAQDEEQGGKEERVAAAERRRSRTRRRRRLPSRRGLGQQPSQRARAADQEQRRHHRCEGVDAAQITIAQEKNAAAGAEQPRQRRDGMQRLRPQPRPQGQAQQRQGEKRRQADDPEVRQGVFAVDPAEHHRGRDRQDDADREVGSGTPLIRPQPTAAAAAQGQDDSADQEIRKRIEEQERNQPDGAELRIERSRDRLVCEHDQGPIRVVQRLDVEAALLAVVADVHVGGAPRHHGVVQVPVLVALEE